MLKTICQRLITGFAITMVVSLGVHMVVVQAVDGCVTPKLVARCGGEAMAMLVQLGLCGLIGAAFSVGAMIFEIGRWSYLRQGVVHFLLTAAVWLPVSMFCWMPSPRSIHFWIGMAGWAFTYAVTWTIQYLIVRRRVAEMNRCIGEYRKNLQEDEA